MLPRCDRTCVGMLSGVDLFRTVIVYGRAHSHIVRDMTIYDRTGGILQRVIHVARALPRPAARNWLLQDVRIYDANMNLVRHVPQLTGLSGVTPAQLTIAKVDPTELDYWTLKRRIAELEAAGRPADEAKAGLAH